MIRKNIIETSQVVLNFCRTIYIGFILFLIIYLCGGWVQVWVWLSLRVCMFVTHFNAYLQLFHDSLTKDWFEGICNRNQQSTRMKVHEKNCHTIFGLNVAGRLVDNAFYVNLTEEQVRISLKRIFMYFRDFSFSSLILKVHKISHSMAKWLFLLLQKTSKYITASVCCLFYHLRQASHFQEYVILRKCDFVTFSRNMIFLKEVSIV